MDAIIIWLGNNAVVSSILSAVFAFLMLVGLVTCIQFVYRLWKRISETVRIKKNYFVKKDEK